MNSRTTRNARHPAGAGAAGVFCQARASNDAGLACAVTEGAQLAVTPAQAGAVRLFCKTRAPNDAAPAFAGVTGGNCSTSRHPGGSETSAKVGPRPLCLLFSRECGKPEPSTTTAYSFCDSWTPAFAGEHIQFRSSLAEAGAVRLFCETRAPNDAAPAFAGVTGREMLNQPSPRGGATSAKVGPRPLCLLFSRECGNPELSKTTAYSFCDSWTPAFAGEHIQFRSSLAEAGAVGLFCETRAPNDAAPACAGVTNHQARIPCSARSARSVCASVNSTAFIPTACAPSTLSARSSMNSVSPAASPNRSSASR